MINVVSLFSGIGSFEKGLENLGIPYTLKGFSEIDKYAIESYCAVHGIDKELNLGDVSKIKNDDLPKDVDLITYGFPCQDISVAGSMQGINGNTRSGLLFEAERIIEHTKPKYAIAENVKNLVSKKFKDDFESLLDRLDGYGYNNYWQVLNAKDYGIPQNRERVFIVSIRKDVDNGKFEFPEPYDGGLRLKDLLEGEVEEKYYIDNEKTSILLNNLKDKEMLPGGINVSKQGKAFDGNAEVASCLLARDYKGLGNQSMTAVIEPILIGGMQKNQSIKRDGISTTLVSAMGTGGGYVPMIVASRGRNPNNPSDRTVGSPTEQRLEPNSQGVANTLTTVQKDNLVLEPTVCEQRTDEGLRFFKDGVVGTLRTIDSCGDKRVLEPKEKFGRMGRQAVAEPNRLGGLYDKNGKRRQAGAVWDKENIAPTVDTCQGGHREPLIIESYRIRKLTPKECWRLMGFADEDYHKARQALEDRFYNGRDRSNSQMYKQAGNSIVVNVVEGIFKNLLGGKFNGR